MLTSLVEFFRMLLFGRTQFIPHKINDELFRSDRLYVRLEWTDYVRSRGIFRRREHMQGLIAVRVYFNPGIPEDLFETVLETGIGSVKFVVNEGSVESWSDDADGVVWGEPRRLGPDNWTFETVARTPDDIVPLCEWFEEIRDAVSKSPDLYGGELTDFENRQMRTTSSILLSGVSKCRLNS